MTLDRDEILARYPLLNPYLTRRSVRRCREEQIREEELSALLTCALYAPTGGNLQETRFLVIQDPEILSELNAAVRSALLKKDPADNAMMAKGIRRAEREDYHFIYHAPTLIAAAAPRNHGNSMADCACGLENILLAAHALGLAGCWANQVRWLTDDPGVREIFQPLGLREDEDLFGSAAIGYPAVHLSGAAAPRKEGRVARI